MDRPEFYQVITNRYKKSFLIFEKDESKPIFQRKKFQRRGLTTLSINGNMVVNEAANRTFLLGAKGYKIVHDPNEKYGYKITYQDTDSKRAIRKELPKFETLKDRFLNSVKDIILNYIRDYPVTGEVYIAFDGTLPDADVQYQRKVNFLNSLVDPKSLTSNGFDLNSLTAGTKLMEEVDQFLLKTFETDDFKMIAPRIVYSSWRVAGQRNHKIAERFRKKKNEEDGDHLAISRDFDLVMLSMISEKKNIFILDEEPRFDRIVFVDKLVDEITQDMKSEKNNPNAKEFLMVTALVGSKYLPQYPLIGRLDFFLDLLINSYKDIDMNIIRGDFISWQAFADFFKKLSEKEDLLIGDFYESKKISLPSFDQSRRLIVGRGEDRKVEFDIYNFSYLYYRSIFPSINDPIFGEFDNEVTPEQIEKMTRYYLKMYTWILKYYTQGYNFIENSYYYGYHYVPLIGDLIRFIDESIDEYESLKLMIIPNANGMMTLEEQLVSVIPRSGSKLLADAKLRKVYDLDSPIYDLYPVDFMLNFDGRMDDDPVANIPMAERSRIESAVEMMSPEKIVIVENDKIFVSQIYMTYMQKCEARRKERSESTEGEGRGGYDGGRGRGEYDTGRGRGFRGRGRGEYDTGRGRGFRGRGRGEYDTGRGRGGYDTGRGRGEYEEDRPMGENEERPMEEGGYDTGRGRGRYDTGRGPMGEGEERPMEEGYEKEGQERTYDRSDSSQRGGYRGRGFRGGYRGGRGRGGYRGGR